MKRLPGFIVVVWVLFMGMTLADTPIDKKVPASRTGLVTVVNIAGTVQVTGWNEAEVQVRGTLAEKLKFNFTSEGERTGIEVEYPRHLRTLVGGADLVIHIPRGSRLEVETVSADVEVKDIKGNLSLKTVSGDMSVEGGAGTMELQAVSGDISARALRDIRSGDFQTVSGDIDLQGPFPASARVQGQTVSGDLTFRACATQAANWKVSTFSGSIENQLQPAGEVGDEDDPGRTLEFTTKGGGARLILNTFSGDISILK